MPRPFADEEKSIEENPLSQGVSRFDLWGQDMKTSAASGARFLVVHLDSNHSAKTECACLEYNGALTYTTDSRATTSDTAPFIDISSLQSQRLNNIYDLNLHLVGLSTDRLSHYDHR